MTTRVSDPLGQLSKAYGVQRDIVILTSSIIGTVPDLQGIERWEAIVQIVGILIQDPKNLQRLQAGKSILRPYREAMNSMVEAYGLTASAADLVQAVLDDISKRLREAR